MSNPSPFSKVRTISLVVSTIPFENEQNEDSDGRGGEQTHCLKNQKKWPKDAVQTEDHSGRATVISTCQGFR